jgi:hypothetical protein
MSNEQTITRLALISEKYIMVNLEDDESETPELKTLLTPEGAGYIPRALFFDAKGELQPQVKNDQNAKYPFFYPSANGLATVMEKAFAQLALESGEEL